MICKILLVLIIIIFMRNTSHAIIPLQEINSAFVLEPTRPKYEFPIATGKCGDIMQIDLSLNFRNVGLQRIDSNFANSTKVSCLSLEDNEITYVSPDAFRLMPHLLYLNLAQNNLSLANFSHLDSHFYLHTLILDNNNNSLNNDGSKLEFKNQFPYLSHLYLRGCGIEDVISLAFAPRLTHLYLSSNYLANSELTFLNDAADTLIGLDLANNGIQTLNASQLVKLRELRLDDNKFGRLCGSKTYCQDSALTLEGVHELRKLSLARNELTSVEPDAFDDTAKLVDLDLSYNKIDSIRKNTFENVENLRNLSLKGNLLTEMPDLYGPKTVENLSLANNQLEVLNNDSFGLINSLRYIDLSNNKIRSVDVGAFAKQYWLEILDLSNNKLTSLPSMWLTSLMYMKDLYLDNNQFSRFDDLKLATVRMQANLKHVYLRNNPITKFSTGSLYSAFKNLPNITLEFSDFRGQSNDADTIGPNTEVCKCDCDENNDISID